MIRFRLYAAPMLSFAGKFRLHLGMCFLTWALKLLPKEISDLHEFKVGYMLASEFEDRVKHNWY